MQKPQQIVPVSKAAPIVDAHRDSILNRYDVVREEEKRIVRGRFIFHEVPKGQLDFVFKKYKYDPIEKYSLKDGEVYSIPLSVARHLNTNCSYPSYNYKNDENGMAKTSISEQIRRASFQSLEFTEGMTASALGSDLKVL